MDSVACPPAARALAERLAKGADEAVEAGAIGCGEARLERTIDVEGDVIGEGVDIINDERFAFCSRGSTD